LLLKVVTNVTAQASVTYAVFIDLLLLNS